MSKLSNALQHILNNPDIANDKEYRRQLVELVREENKPDRHELIVLIVNAITKNPDWLKDIIWAMQEGIALALQKERHNAADLAYGYVDVFDLAGEKIRKEHANRSGKSGLPALADMFATAPVEETIRKYILEEMKK
jgi:hypothetical protein